MAQRSTRKKPPVVANMADARPVDELHQENTTPITSITKAEKFLNDCGIWATADARTNMHAHLERAVAQFAVFVTKQGADDTIIHATWAIYHACKKTYANTGKDVEKALRIAETLDAKTLATALNPLISKTITDAVNQLAAHDPDLTPSTGPNKLDVVLQRLEELPSSIQTAIDSSSQNKPLYSQVLANQQTQEKNGSRTYDQQNAIARVGVKERQLLLNAKRGSTRDWLEAPPLEIINRFNAAVKATVKQCGFPEFTGEEKSLCAETMQKLRDDGAI